MDVLTLYSSHQISPSKYERGENVFCACLDLSFESISNWLRLGILDSARGDILSGKGQRIHQMALSRSRVTKSVYDSILL